MRHFLIYFLKSSVKGGRSPPPFIQRVASSLRLSRAKASESTVLLVQKIFFGAHWRRREKDGAKQSFYARRVDGKKKTRMFPIQKVDSRGDQFSGQERNRMLLRKNMEIHKIAFRE